MQPGRQALASLPHLRSVLGGERLRELERTCPGALAFSDGLFRGTGEMRGVANALLADLAADRTLDRAVADAVRRWIGLGRDGIGVLPALLHPARWEWAWTASRTELDRMVRGHRLLVRRAAQGVTPEALVRPPWMAVVPEDIPLGPAEAGPWYALVSSLAPGPTHAADVASAVRATRWLSANALTALALEKEELLTRDDVRACIDWVVTSRRPLARTTRVLALRSEWEHETLYAPVDGIEPPPGDALADVLRVAPEEVSAYPLPRPPVVGTEDVSLRFFDTVGDLLREGAEMRNCLRTSPTAYLPSTRWVVGATVSGENLTLQLGAALGGDIVLSQAVRVGDARPTETQQQVLDAWLEEMNSRELDGPAPF